MAKERERLVEILENSRRVSFVTEQDVIHTLAEYDAMVATKGLPFYALLSTIVAAISAIASAFAAFFAYAALHVSH